MEFRIDFGIACSRSKYITDKAPEIWSLHIKKRLATPKTRIIAVAPAWKLLIVSNGFHEVLSRQPYGQGNMALEKYILYSSSFFGLHNSTFKIHQT